VSAIRALSRATAQESAAAYAMTQQLLDLQPADDRVVAARYQPSCDQRSREALPLQAALWQTWFASTRGWWRCF